MDVLESLPGSSVVDPTKPKRSSYHHPAVQSAVEKLDPYRSAETWERDARKPKRSKGSPA